MKIHCPQCKGTFRVEGHETGTQVECPFCMNGFSFRDKDHVIASDSPTIEVQIEEEKVSSPHNEDEPFPSDKETLIQTKSKPSVKSNETTAFPSPLAGDPNTVANELTDLRVGQTVDGYRLDKVVGSGGMSVVFRAHQMSLGRDVAFKVLRKDLGADPEFAQRFNKEARALAELNHPNIVAVHDQGMVDGHYYLVMEFIDGVSLREVLSDHKLKSEEALTLIPPLCAALEYAHDKGIIHRDIKPENILLNRDGKPLIADFGLVRLLGETNMESVRLTKTQAILGTLDYMSPEQREGRGDVDHRADIYSLGVVIYEMLTGELPIARFPRPSECAKLDSRLDDVVLKILEKDRDRRYQRASQVARDIDSIGRGHPSSIHQKVPQTYGGRLLTMGSSFSFFFFTATFIVFMSMQRDDEALAIGFALAIPFYLGQFVLNGLLPRPMVDKKNFFVRRPIIAFGALSLLGLIIANEGNRGVDTLGAMTIGLCISSAISIWSWRQSIFRHHPEDSLFVPWAGEPEGYQELRQGRFPSLSSTAVNGSKDLVSALLESKSGSRPSVHEVAKTTGKEPDGSVSNDSKEQPSITPVTREKSFSAMTLFAFLLSLPIFAYSLFLGVFAALGGIDFLLAFPISVHDLRYVLPELWQQPINLISNSVIVLAVALVLPIMIPAFILALAIPGAIKNKRQSSSNKKYGSLFAITSVVITLSLSISTISVADIYDTVNTNYLRQVSLYYGSSNERSLAINSALEVIKVSVSPVRTMGAFHRIHLLGIGGVPESIHSELADLVFTARDPNTKAAAYILLREITKNKELETVLDYWGANQLPKNLRELVKRDRSYR